MATTSLGKNHVYMFTYKSINCLQVKQISESGAKKVLM